MCVWQTTQRRPGRLFERYVGLKLRLLFEAESGPLAFFAAGDLDDVPKFFRGL